MGFPTPLTKPASTTSSTFATSAFVMTSICRARTSYSAGFQMLKAALNKLRKSNEYPCLDRSHLPLKPHVVVTGQGVLTALHHLHPRELPLLPPRGAIRIQDFPEALAVT